MTGVPNAWPARRRELGSLLARSGLGDRGSPTGAPAGPVLYAGKLQL